MYSLCADDARLKFRYFATQGDEYSLKCDDNTLCFDSELTVNVVEWLLTRLQTACVSEFKIDGLEFLWPVVEIFQKQGQSLIERHQRSGMVAAV